MPEGILNEDFLKQFKDELKLSDFTDRFPKQNIEKTLKRN